MTVSPRTVLDYINVATKHLENSGVDTPRLDAEVLLGDVLQLERIQLYVQYDRPLVSAEVQAYREHIARRARREPVAYIVGRKEFRSFTLKVDSRVLIPRPETELLVEEALKQLETSFGDGTGLRVADVGTGSGAIAIGMAMERDDLAVIATDVDPDSLALAKENIHEHELADRIECRLGDMIRPLVGERLHAIVSNPPYVRPEDWQNLQPEVRVFEPKHALVGGSDGLEPFRRLLSEAPEVLCPGGFVAVEMGADQAKGVQSLALEAGYTDCRIVKDLGGRDRMAVMIWEGRSR